MNGLFCLAWQALADASGVPIFQQTANFPAHPCSALTSLPLFFCFHAQSIPHVAGTDWLGGFGGGGALCIAVREGSMLKTTVLDSGSEQKVVDKRKGD